MNKEEYLYKVRKQIYFIFDRDCIEEELKDHLYESMQDLIEDGYSVKEAEEQAVKQMGDPVEVGKLLNKEHQPLLGYLWMLSQGILALLIIPVVLILIVGGYGAVRNVTPATIENSVETISLNIDIDMPTHKIKIDNICKDEGERCYLTYRTWCKVGYTRAGWIDDLFDITDSNGEYLYGSGGKTNRFLSSDGYKEFTWPEDDILILKFIDGNIVEIDLKEYHNETE